MASSTSVSPDVFTPREIARAAGASLDDAEALLESGRIVSRDGLVGSAEAVRAVLLLRGVQAGPSPARDLFSDRLAAHHRRAMPLTASSLLHAAFGAVLLLAVGLSTEARVVPEQL